MTPSGAQEAVQSPCHLSANITVPTHLTRVLNVIDNSSKGCRSSLEALGHSGHCRLHARDKSLQKSAFTVLSAVIPKFPCFLLYSSKNSHSDQRLERTKLGDGEMIEVMIVARDLGRGYGRGVRTELDKLRVLSMACLPPLHFLVEIDLINVNLFVQSQFTNIRFQLQFSRGCGAALPQC